MSEREKQVREREEDTEAGEQPEGLSDAAEASRRQDTQPVEGEDAMNLPPETDLIQRPKIQG